MGRTRTLLEELRSNEPGLRPASLRVELSAEPTSVPRVRDELDAWLTALEAGDDDRHALGLAASEAATNVVEHAYPHGVVGRLRVEAVLGDDGVVRCRVEDDGRWRPVRADDGRRGRGLLLAAQVVDEVEVAPGVGGATFGSVVTLRHRLTRPAGAQSA